jgi:CubicO group peptidase (beta-lactamase class C family)
VKIGARKVAYSWGDVAAVAGSRGAARKPGNKWRAGARCCGEGWRGRPGPSATRGRFGSPGSGGSLGFADPTVGVGYDHVTNQMGTRQTGDPRDVRLRRAIYCRDPIVLNPEKGLEGVVSLRPNVI